MKKMISYLIIYILTFSPYIQGASYFTITEPGTYPIVGNISYASTSSSDSIIAINSSNVTVDLNGSVLTQSNGSAMTAGIAVASNVTNVTIKNGTIVAVQGSGVSLSNNQLVTLDNITTISCITGVSASNSSFVNMQNVNSLFSTGAGISLSSFCNFIELDNLFIYLSTSDGLDLVQTSNCLMNNCAVSSAGGQGISANTCSTLSLNNVAIQSCVTNGIKLLSVNGANINNCSIANITGQGIAITNSTLINLDNVSATTCTTSAINLFEATNCSINNCNVSNITGIGFSINNSNLIYLDNVMATSCTNIAYNLSNISTCDIQNAQAFDCSTSGSTVFNLNQCNSMNVSNCNFVRNGSNSNPFNIMNLVGCTSSLFQDIVLSASSITNQINGVLTNQCTNDVFRNINVINSYGANLDGFFLSNNSTTSCLFDGCTLENSNGDNGAVMAFELNASNNNNIFRNCHSINNIGATARGFDIGSPTFNLVFDRCTVRNITATATTNFGFVMTGVTSANYNNVTVENLVGSNISSATGYFISNCINCNFLNTLSHNMSAQTGFGFDVISSTSCHLIQCQAHNTFGTSAATGIIFSSCNSCNLIRSTILETGTTGAGLIVGIEFVSSNSCAAQDNITIRNMGTSPNNSVGFLTQSTIGNTYIRNTALGNGLNLAGFVSNNFVSPAAGSATGNDTNDSITPWTNFGIAGF